MVVVPGCPAPKLTVTGELRRGLRAFAEVRQRRSLRQAEDVFDKPLVADAPVRLISAQGTEPPHLHSRPILGAAPLLVSCLMVTAARPTSARLAVECFQRQSYPNRELVIIDDGQTDDLADYVAGLGDERIRMVRLASTDKTLGELRNAAVANARGDLVCQWDDDDLSDPDRLWWQVGVLNDSGAEACFLERWTILWSDGPRIAIGTRRLWEGSMVARREVVVEYPALRRGEDSPVAEAIVSRGTVALLDLPELYIYLVHGNNTFDAAHFDAHWDAATVRVENPNLHLAHLQKRVPVAQALAAVAGPTS